VLGGDGLLKLTTTDAEVVVEGYDGDPFLRVGPDGVFANRNSPATYLNADFYANITVPAGVDSSAPPELRRVSDATRWQWHDHRIHWMAPTAPTAVRDRPDVGRRVAEWVVPFGVDGDRFDVRGCSTRSASSGWSAPVVTRAVLAGIAAVESRPQCQGP
jgi:hypothetical protein